MLGFRIEPQEKINHLLAVRKAKQTSIASA